MKYIKKFDNQDDSIESIKKIIKEHGLIGSIDNYTINSDGSIDVNGDVSLSNKNFLKLPIRFGKVTGYFRCSYNRLTSLEGCPYYVGGDFTCNNNCLMTLKGGPKEVAGHYSCSYNQLHSLEGAAEEVGGTFYCNNNLLPNLKYCPAEIGGNMNCSDNNLSDLDISSIIGGNLYCKNNNINEEDYNFYGEVRRIIFIDLY